MYINICVHLVYSWGTLPPLPLFNRELVRLHHDHINCETPPTCTLKRTCDWGLLCKWWKALRKRSPFFFAPKKTTAATMCQSCWCFTGSHFDNRMMFHQGNSDQHLLLYKEVASPCLDLFIFLKAQILPTKCGVSSDLYKSCLTKW